MSDHSGLTFDVYDRTLDDNSFLGCIEMNPVLIHDHTVDQWLKSVGPCYMLA